MIGFWINVCRNGINETKSRRRNPAAVWRVELGGWVVKTKGKFIFCIFSRFFFLSFWRDFGMRDFVLPPRVGGCMQWKWQKCALFDSVKGQKQQPRSAAIAQLKSHNRRQQKNVQPAHVHSISAKSSFPCGSCAQMIKNARMNKMPPRKNEQ